MDQIGDRIKLASEAVGGLNKLAEAIGLPRRTLGERVSGKAEPKMSEVVDIARATGYTITWLATGDGPRREGEAAEAQATAVKTIGPTIQMVAALVERLHREAGSTLPKISFIAELSEKVVMLIDKSDNAADLDELTALLPWLEMQIRRELVKENVGTGKHGASA